MEEKTTTQTIDELIKNAEDLKQYFTGKQGEVWISINNNGISDLAKWVGKALILVEETQNKKSLIYNGFLKYCTDIYNMTTIDLDVCIGYLKSISETYEEPTGIMD